MLIFVWLREKMFEELQGFKSGGCFYSSWFFGFNQSETCIYIQSPYISQTSLTQLASQTQKDLKYLAHCIEEGFTICTEIISRVCYCSLQINLNYKEFSKSKPFPQHKIGSLQQVGNSYMAQNSCGMKAYWHRITKLHLQKETFQHVIKSASSHRN